MSTDVVPGVVAVVLVSLTAGTVAAAAPTPGGIGAVEAVLLASLTGLGIPSGAWAFRSLTARSIL